jgi:Coenzyme PQQ synthesis protein D (PqqD)
MHIEAMSAPSDRLQPNPNVVYRELQEGGVLLNLDSGQYYGLNEIGCAIWELVDGDRTLDDVVEALRVRLADEPPDLKADVAGFVRGLADRQLIVP